MLRLTTWLLLGAAVSALTSCSTTESVNRKNTSRTFNTVVIDAGHGGKDSGAVRRYGPAEKNATLDVAERLNGKLRRANFRTVMIRSSDVFVPLDERVAIGNQQPNSIFVSIHFNDSPRRGVHGFETYYNSPYARDLADRIQFKLSGVRHASNRGVRTANYRVIRKAIYPSVLVECGFLSNRGEAGEIASGAFRDTLATKIGEAIVEERYGSGGGTEVARSGTTGSSGTSGAH